MSASMAEQLQALIAAELAGPDPDPRRIAHRIADVLPAESIHAALVEALVSRVRTAMAHFHRARQRGEEVPQRLGFEGQRLRVSDRHTWKFLVDCTSSELRFAADRLRRAAASMVEDADRIAARADVLDRCGCPTSRQLGVTTPAEVA